MKKQLLSSVTILALVILGATSAFAQSIRLKSSSEKHLKVVFTGVNNKGKEITRTIEDVGLGFWKTFSLYKTKYGYDLYNNKEMKADGADGSNRWTKMVVTDEKTSANDMLDLTQDIDEKKLANTRLWVRVKIKYDNDYQLTYISFFDHRKN